MEKELKKVRKLNRLFYWLVALAIVGGGMATYTIVMLIKLWKKLCVLGVIAVFWSCEDTATSIPSAVANEVYQFQEEARAHGLNVNLNGLKIEYGSLDGFTAGKAYPSRKVIILDSLSSAFHINRRCLVFHEMAHIFVPGRQKHDNSVMGLTEVEKSIMNGNSLPICTGSWDYRWQYYVDELFNPKTPIPEWANHY